jgi:hypothetical protein
MEKIAKVINSPLFKSAAGVCIGIALLLEKHPLYAGIAFGYSAREFFLAFKDYGKV